MKKIETYKDLFEFMTSEAKRFDIDFGQNLSVQIYEDNSGSYYKKGKMVMAVSLESARMVIGHTNYRMVSEIQDIVNRYADDFRLSKVIGEVLDE